MKEFNYEQFFSGALSTKAMDLCSSQYFHDYKVQVQLIQHITVFNVFKSIDSSKNANKIHIFFLVIWT